MMKWILFLAATMVVPMLHAQYEDDDIFCNPKNEKLYSANTPKAQRLKVNYKGKIKPHSFKIEKIEVGNGQTTIYAEVKQQKNFSYNILFDECLLTPNSTLKPIVGKLDSWNESKNVSEFAKPISDNQTEKFTLVFPGTDILSADSFDIKIGTIQNRKKTPIVFDNVTIRK